MKYFAALKDDGQANDDIKVRSALDATPAAPTIVSAAVSAPGLVAPIHHLKHAVSRRHKVRKRMRHWHGRR